MKCERCGQETKRLDEGFCIECVEEKREEAPRPGMAIPASRSPMAFPRKTKRPAFTTLRDGKVSCSCAQFAKTGLCDHVTEIKELALKGIFPFGATMGDAMAEIHEFLRDLDSWW